MIWRVILIWLFGLSAEQSVFALLIHPTFTVSDKTANRAILTDGLGRSLQVFYNNQGLPVTISNAFGVVRQTLYDSVNRPISVTDANGITVTRQFDLIDELLGQTWPDGLGESFGYSAAGLITYTNRDGQRTLYDRDGAGRLIAETNANGEHVEYSLDSLNHLLSLADGLNHTNVWQFNQYGWMTNKIDGRGSNVFRFSYNANGWPTNRWTPQNGNAGYTYDNVGNLLNIAYGPLSIGYSYDALNRRTNMVDGIGTTAWTYTPVGQLASESGPWSNATVTNTYTQSLRTTMAILQSGGGWTNTYAFDSMWRMTGLTSPAGTFPYAYGFHSTSSLVTGISLPNGANIVQSYTSLGQLQQTALVNFWGHILDGYTYSMDPLGLRTNIVRMLGLTTNSVSVGYDNIGQIISWLAKESSGVARQNEQYGWSFDQADNLHGRNNGAMSQTFNVDAANELLNVARSGAFTLSGATPAPATNITVNGLTAQTYGDFTFARTNLILLSGTNSFTNIAKNIYGLTITNAFSLNLPTNVVLTEDYSGNLISDGTRTFSWDYENQLTNVMVAGQWQMSFAYDGLNRRRIARTFTWNGTGWTLASEVHYIWDGLLPIQERDTNGNVLVTYTRGVDLSGSINGAGGIGGLLARTDTNGSTYYHADGSGNITALMDGDQNIVARYLYGAFGKPLGQRGTMANANVMQFSSMPYYGIPGVVGYWGRFYDPNLQRWLNQDPIGIAGGVNPYRFTHNSPLNRIDPYGLLDPSTVSKAITVLNDTETTIQAGGSALSLGAIAGGTATAAAMSPLIMGLLGMDPQNDPYLNPNGVNAAPNYATSVLPKPLPTPFPFTLLTAPPTQPLPCQPQKKPPGKYYHYSANPNLAGSGLKPNSWVTDTPNLPYDRALSITFIEDAPSILSQYPVIVPDGTPIIPMGLVNGLNQYQLPAGTPLGTVGVPTPIVRANVN